LWQSTGIGRFLGFGPWSCRQTPDPDGGSLLDPEDGLGHHDIPKSEEGCNKINAEIRVAADFQGGNAGIAAGQPADKPGKLGVSGGGLATGVTKDSLIDLKPAEYL